MRHVGKIFISTVLALIFFSVSHASHTDETEISTKELTKIISSTLNHKDVSMFLHPDVPGRVPVVIALGKPYSYRPVELEMYGEPVIVSTNTRDLKKAVKLRIKCSYDACKIKIDYDPEGMFGEINFTYKQNEWVIQKISLYE